jgi:hypothetical protein
MNTYQIEGTRILRVEGDEITRRGDGSLWLLRSMAKPAAQVPVLILARGQWSAVHVEQHADAILFLEAQPPPAKPGPRLLP